MTPLEVARIAYEVNRAYCAALGDHSQPEWTEAAAWQLQSVLDGIRFHQQHPGAGPEASHNNWLAMKRGDGWVYGPEKDPEAKTHPCIVPFDELPQEQQAKDFLFRAVVHALEPYLD